LYFWNNIFLDLLWSAFIKNMDLIKQGQSPTNFETNHLQPYPASNP
jgi:hypothetical protein